MKNKPRPTEYKFIRKKDKIYLEWRFRFGYGFSKGLKAEDYMWCFSGLITEDDVKTKLTTKQFAKFKAGHDFFLTHNRHGAGFWDGDWPKEIGDKLTEESHNYGETNFWVSEEKIYCD